MEKKIEAPFDLKSANLVIKSFTPAKAKLLMLTDKHKHTMVVRVSLESCLRPILGDSRLSRINTPELCKTLKKDDIRAKRPDLLNDLVRRGQGQIKLVEFNAAYKQVQERYGNDGEPVDNVLILMNQAKTEVESMAVHNPPERGTRDDKIWRLQKSNDRLLTENRKHAARIAELETENQSAYKTRQKIEIENIELRKANFNLDADNKRIKAEIYDLNKKIEEPTEQTFWQRLWGSK